MIEAVLVQGTVYGATAALLALGFSLVYGVGGILNLAHGAFYLMTVYVIYETYAFLCLSPIGLPVSTGLIIGIAVALAVVIAIAIVTYIALIKPLEHNEIGVTIVTFGAAFLFEQFIKYFWGTSTESIPYLIQGTSQLGAFKFPNQFLLVIVGTFILVAALVLIIKKTTIGKSIRAVSQDMEAAKLMGINPHKVLLVCMVLSAILAGSAAVLYIPGNSIMPQIGWSTLLTAFAVTIFGGLGSIPGCLLGGFIMGYTIAFSNWYINPIVSDLIPIIIIFLMLIIRPQGLLGKKRVS